MKNYSFFSQTDQFPNYPRNFKKEDKVIFYKQCTRCCVYLNVFLTALHQFPEFDVISLILNTLEVLIIYLRHRFCSSVLWHGYHRQIDIPETIGLDKTFYPYLRNVSGTTFSKTMDVPARSHWNRILNFFVRSFCTKSRSYTAVTLAHGTLSPMLIVCWE